MLGFLGGDTSKTEGPPEVSVQTDQTGKKGGSSAGNVAATEAEQDQQKLAEIAEEKRLCRTAAQVLATLLILYCAHSVPHTQTHVRAHTRAHTQIYTHTVGALRRRATMPLCLPRCSPCAEPSELTVYVACTSQIRNKPVRTFTEPNDESCSITTCVFSPDGTSLAYAGSNKCVVVQDVYAEGDDSFQLIPERSPEDPEGKLDFPVMQLRYSMDGRLLAVLFGEGDKIRLTVYSIKRDEQQKLRFTEVWGESGAIEPSGELQQMAFSHDSKWVVYADKTELKIVRTCLIENALDGPYPAAAAEGVTMVEVSPDGRLIASCDAEAIQLWWPPELEVITHGLTSSLLCCTTKTDDAEKEDGEAAEAPVVEEPTWNPHGGSEIHLFRPASRIKVTGVQCLCFSPGSPGDNGQRTAFLTTGLEKAINVWELPGDEGNKLTFGTSGLDKQSNILVHTYESNELRDVSAVCYSNSGDQLASVCDNGWLHVWDVATETVVTKYRHPQNTGTRQAGEMWEFFAKKQVAISPDNTLIATVGGSNSVMLREMETDRKLFSAHHMGKVLSVCCSPDGKYIATGGNDNCLKVYHCTDATEDKQSALVEVAKVYQHRSPISSLAFSPQSSTFATGQAAGQLLATGTKTKVTLWWIVPDEPPKSYQYKKHSYDVTALAFSGNQMASGDAGGNIIIWDTKAHILAGWKALPAINAKVKINALAFSCSGRHLAAGNAEGLKVFHVGSARLTSSYPEAGSVQRTVTALAFSHSETGGEFITIGTADPRKVDEEEDTKDDTAQGTEEAGEAKESFTMVGRVLTFPTEKFERQILTPAWQTECPPVSAIDFSPDDKNVIVATNSISNSNKTKDLKEGLVSFYDKQRGQADNKKKMNFSTSVFSLAVPSKQMHARFQVFVGTDEKGLLVRSPGQSQIDKYPPQPHEGNSMCCSFSADGKYLVSGGDDCTVYIYVVESGKRITWQGDMSAGRIEGYKVDSTIIHCSYTTSGKSLWIADSTGKMTLLAISEDGSPDDLDVPFKKVGPSVMSIVAVSPKESLLQFACVDENRVLIADMHNMQSNNVDKELEHTCKITACAYSHDGRLLSIGDVAGFITTWTTSADTFSANWSLCHSFDAFKTPVTALMYEPDTTFLAIGSYNALLVVHNALDGCPHQTLAVKETSKKEDDDGAVEEEETPEKAEAQMEARRTQDFEPHDNRAVLGITFADKAKYIAHSTANGRVLVTEVSSDTRITSLNFDEFSPHCCAFSQVNERHVLAVSAGPMAMWDIERLGVLGPPIEQLFAYVADLDDKGHAYPRDVKFVMSMMEKYPHLLFATSREQRTVIQEAVLHSNKELVEALIEKYPFCTVILNQGSSTFRIACENQAIDMLQTLLTNVSRSISGHDARLKPTQLQAVVDDLPLIIKVNADQPSVIVNFFNSLQLRDVPGGKSHKVSLRGIRTKSVFRNLAQRFGTAKSQYYTGSRSAYDITAWASIGSGAGADEQAVQMNEMQIPLPHLAEVEIIEKLTMIADSTIFENEVVASLVNCVWDNDIAKRFYREFAAYLMLLASFIVFSLLLAREDPDHVLVDDMLQSPRGIITLGLHFPLVVLALYHIKKEVYQFIDGGCDLLLYIRDPFNIVELSGYVALLVAPVLHIFRQDGLREVTAVASVALLFNILQHLRGFSSMGPLVRTVTLIVEHLQNFALVLFVIVFAFANSFFLLHHDLVPESTSMSNSTNGTAVGLNEETVTHDPRTLGFLDTLVLSFFNPDDNMIREKPLACVLFILYMFIVNIVMMNMLIAIMNDVYNSIAQDFHSEFMKVRATVIADFLSIMEEEECEKIKKKFRWIYVLKQHQVKDTSVEDEEIQRKRLENRVLAFVRGVDGLAASAGVAKVR